MPESQRPNIVMIMVDDADRKTLQYSTRIKAAIGDQGAIASRYLLNQPICAPSRASFLRGRYAHNTGVEGNDNAYADFIANGGEQSNIGTWLHTAGYRTALVGKYMNHYPQESGHGPTWVPPGWDYWFGLFGNAYDSYNYEANDNGTVVEYGADATDYVTDVLRAKSLEFLGSPMGQEPFMLVVSPMAPHSPSVPAPRHVGLYPGVKYPKGSANPSFNEADVSDKPWYVSKLPLLKTAQIQKIDQRFPNKLRSMEAVADLVEAIIAELDDDQDRLARTYIFFTSDNGFHMGEHRLGQNVVQDDFPGGVPGGKNMMYEEDIRVPLWVRGPGIAPGTTIDELLGNVDLAPTFRAIAGMSPAADIDGRSFLPLLNGESIPWRTRYLISRGEPKRFAGIRSQDDYVFAELDYPQPTEVAGEFYDLVADLPELNNLYLDLTPTELSALQNWLTAYRTCAGDSCRLADSS